MTRTSLILAASLLAALAAPASAQEIRIARQFSMGYLQFNVMEHDKLLEKHAAALGLKDVKIVWATFNGPDAMNNALISDSIDIVAGGVPGLLTLWNRTRGTANEVKGISALSSQPFLLNTRSDNIKSIADLKDSDRIAVPAVKVSVQAVTLQMAAAKLFGEKNFGKLDSLTVSMSPPDSTIALLTGTGEINNVFGVPPFQQQQLEKPGIRTILIVDKDRAKAAGFWIEDVKSKLPLDKVTAVISGPQVHWTMTPLATMKYAAFMHSVGSLKEAPKSWKDLFFPEVHDLNGS